MENRSNACTLSLFLGTLSLLFSVLAIVVCATAYRAKQPSDTAVLAVLGQAQDSVLSDVLSDAPSGDQAPPSSSVENEIDPSELSPSPPVYTVRLSPSDQANSSEICIYDASNALVMQASLPFATLTPGDQAALQTGIVAKDLESARQLVRDFCG